MWINDTINVPDGLHSVGELRDAGLFQPSSSNCLNASISGKWQVIVLHGHLVTISELQRTPGVLLVPARGISSILIGYLSFKRDKVNDSPAFFVADPSTTDFPAVIGLRPDSDNHAVTSVYALIRRERR